MNQILDNLNEEQKEAVLTTEGPVLILAGAGSGKTKVLTHRVAYLIRGKKIQPENILAVTFTNKASKEMMSRIVALLGGNPLEKISYNTSFNRNFPTMGTFHSICARILREEGHYLGYKRSFTIYDESDSLSAIKKSFLELQIIDKKAAPQGVKSYISSAKNELLDPTKYADLSSGYFQELVAKVYPVYQRILARNNALDFDDLLFETVKLFQKFPEVLERYQKLWQYIHIDEYQDTNHAQYMFIKLLAQKNQNLCVVGDDWQSIYSWRGANFQNILDFERDYPEAKVIKLEQNYRNTKAIIDSAHRIISKNENRSEKKLWTENEAGLPLMVAELYNEQEEAKFIIQESGRLKREEELQLNDMVILYRTNAQSRAIETELIRFNIPYRIIGGVRFYERKEIKDILAYLRVINSDDDWIALERIVNMPPRGIGATSMKKLLDYGQKHKLSISRCLEQLSEININPKASQGLKDFARQIEVFRRSKETETLHELVDLILNKSGYADFLDDGTLNGEERLENVKELLSVVEDYTNLNGKEANLDGFLEEVALIADIDNWDASEEALTLMTLHSAKGLEFKIVFIIGMEDNLFPHSNSFFDPEQLEEERRLCYVGITRAKERVYFTLAERRMLYGGIHANPPSRFLADLPENLVANYQKIASNDYETKPLTDENFSSYYNIGDQVIHGEFGEGKIIDMDDDDLKVDFGQKHGRKWLSLTYANLRKKER
ncbi:MAG: UvrD-helicase domain-containing protein [Patescibacteria group bacterium]|nr:UvrD-helicase domain-containing protein [Patescibacteria group bacterium]